MSTTFEIGRWPAAISRCLSHSGDGPICTSSNTRAVKRRQISGSISIETWSSAESSPRGSASASVGSSASGAPRHRVQVARHAVDAHQVGPVGRDLELEHLVGDRQVLGERRAHRDVAVEHHDPVVVLADADLVLGQDHPARLHAAQLRLAERRAVGHDRARQRHRHRLPGGDVGRAADDRLRLVAAHVDLADA